jgi:hypothetical protein
MRNPLKDEATAFRLVFIVLGALAVLALASWISTWLGIVVLAIELAIGVWVLWGGRKPPPVREQIARRGGVEDAHRILVVANETVGGAELREALRAKAAGKAEEILVVCPALNSKLRTWTSDEDGARSKAQARLDASLARLREAGVEARGEIGDGDPLQALEDALRTFPADEIIVSTHPPGRSNWLEAGVVSRAEQRFDVPVTHVVVDLTATT